MKELLKYGIMPGSEREYNQESIYLKMARDFGTNIKKNAVSNKFDTTSIKHSAFTKPEALDYIDDS